MNLDALEELPSPDVDPHDAGYVLGVAVAGDLVWSTAAGTTRNGAGMPLGTGTTFYVASVAKQFTAACVALLIDDGRITDGTPVRELLPELPSAFDGVVLTDLVHHISGVPSLEGDGRHAPGTRWWTGLGTWEMVEQICAIDELEHPEGTSYRYANEGYLLLAAVVERVTGSAPNAFATARLFAPLGMARSFFRDEPVAPRAEAAGHSDVDDIDVDTLVMDAVDRVMASSLDRGLPDWRATLRPDGLLN